MKFRKKWAGKWDLASPTSELSLLLFTCTYRRTGRKKLGGQKEICPTFSDCARVVKKISRKNFPKLLSTGGGGGGEE